MWQISYNESLRVDYCIGNIFNVISLMIITRHPVLHMQLWPKYVVVYSYVNINTHISQYIHCECVYLLFNVCNDGLKNGS
jgi:hypothetical protein